MPIYEFFCPKNNKIYSFFARSLAYAGATPSCPDNPKFPMERMISSFSVTGRAREETEPAGLANDPNMEAMMSEMEREFSALDSDNPDPRRVAQMMRSLTKVSGEKMPEQMEEMVRRLESGESLDKLEEEMGDAMEALDPGSGGEPGGENASEVKMLRERLRAARKRPVRDPVMYEMADYAKRPGESATGKKARGSRGRVR